MLEGWEPTPRLRPVRLTLFAIPNLGFDERRVPDSRSSSLSLHDGIQRAGMRVADMVDHRKVTSRGSRSP